jgi:hypothetical protein
MLGIDEEVLCGARRRMHLLSRLSVNVVSAGGT